MRSIIHEASTIAKAIEQGWIKAGKPKDFTIKIFEEPQKNFFGFTTRNAKVGIFVEDKQQRQEHRPKKHAPQHRRPRHRKERPWGDQQERPFDRQDGQRPQHPQDRQQFRNEPRDQQRRQHDRPQDQQRQQQQDAPHNPSSDTDDNDKE